MMSVPSEHGDRNDPSPRAIRQRRCFVQPDCNDHARQREQIEMVFDEKEFLKDWNVLEKIERAHVHDLDDANQHRNWKDKTERDS